MLSNNEIEFSTSSKILHYLKYKPILFIFVTFCLIRIVLIFVPPLFTTDLARSLFYGKHFWSVGFNVYKFTPIQIDPNFSIIDPTTGQLAWPNNTYDYGLISILFYALLALIPLNSSELIIVSKVVFNIIDLGSFLILILLFPRNKEIPIAYWIFLTPFSSIEGQPVSITILFFILGIYFYSNNKKILGYIFIALGFHWKYVTLLLLPYFLINDFYIYYSLKNKSISDFNFFLKPIISFFVVILLFMFPIFFSPYILSYISFGGNLPVISDPWNPFYIGRPYTLSSVLLLVLIIYILFSWYQFSKEVNKNIVSGISYLPILGLFTFLLIYKYAFPWYWMWSIPLYSIFPSKVKKIFFIFSLICIIAAIEFINLTVGINYILNF
jgi:hypothetical protein